MLISHIVGALKRDWSFIIAVCDSRFVSCGSSAGDSLMGVWIHFGSDVLKRIFVFDSFPASLFHWGTVCNLAYTEIWFRAFFSSFFLSLTSASVLTTM